jgi:hypothetical protein
VALRDELDMAVPDSPRVDLTISLSEPLRLQLAAIAREAQTTEDELVQRAISSIVQTHRGLAIPRFARRLGPVALARDSRAAV